MQTERGADFVKLREMIGSVEDEKLRSILFEFWLEGLASRRTITYAISVLDGIVTKFFR